MKQLSIYGSLGIKTPSIISFIGAGGKTTLLQRLAAEMVASQQKILLTTTTKIYAPPDIPLFLQGNLKKTLPVLENHFKNLHIAVLGRNILPDGKVEGICASSVNILRDYLKVSVLVEADGAKGKPIKGYADHEPILPSQSDFVVAVIGSDALGAVLSAEIVHRLDIFIKSMNVEMEQSINVDMIAASYKKMSELGMTQAPEAETVLILNKVDLLKNLGFTALEVAKRCSGSGISGRILFTQANQAEPVKITMQSGLESPYISVSCIVLAAGTSTRMGEDKLKLDYNGKNILEHTIDNIREAGIKDIIVVVRPDHDWEKLLTNKGCRLIENIYFRTGMSSSLKAGLEAVDFRTQGVMVALADQPLIPSEFYRKLLISYNNNMKSVTCPVYSGKRGNPVIFDRQVWPQLMRITGDQGGRKLINMLAQNNVDYVETEFSTVLKDIDTPDDYRSLLEDKS